MSAIECTEKKSKEAATREFGVCSKHIREWCKQKDQFRSMIDQRKSKRKKSPGGGRKELPRSTVGREFV
jgi:hypothetical protein